MSAFKDNLTVPGWEDDEYKAFVEKFIAKKTTDDCYTPENVYDAVADWVSKEYGFNRANFVRPFYPGGDFEAEEYAPDVVVVDNPPFSIISRIVSFYTRQGIRFFLFAPALTLFSSVFDSVTYLPIGVSIMYENGAEVPTSFITNLDDPEILVRTVPSLYSAVKLANEKNKRQGKAELPKYEYPDHVLTAALAQRWCKYGVLYALNRRECLFIRALDEQRQAGKAIFGSGFLLSTRAAAERAAAERAAAERAAAKTWSLSREEKMMIDYLDKS